MKKFLAILFAAIFAVAPLWGCGTANIKDIAADTTVPSTQTDEATEKSDASELLPEGSIETISRGKSYHVYKRSDDLCTYYDLYNSVGQLVYSEKTERPLTVREISEELIDILEEYGSGIIGHRYHSIAIDKMSLPFYYVIANHGSVVAYLDGEIESRRLVVQDAFQASILYEFTDLNLSAENTPVLEASFSDDASALRIKYMSGENKEVVQKELILNETSKIKNEKYLQYSDIIESIEELWDKSVVEGMSYEEMYAAFDIPNNGLDRKIFIEVYSLMVHTNNGVYDNGFLGYAQKDINGDGSDELLILNDKGTVFRIFSMSDQGPRVVGTFVTLGTANSPVCYIEKDGRIYLTQYGKGRNAYRAICRLSEDGILEEELVVSCKDDNIDDPDVEYYKRENNKRTAIEKEEYSKLLEEHFIGIFMSDPDNIKSLDLEFLSFPNHPIEGEME